LAYVAHLEEQIRSHEATQAKANSQLQKIARKLNMENQKMKKALIESCGLAEAEIDAEDAGTLVEKIANKRARANLLQDVESVWNGYSSETRDISAEHWSYHSLSEPFPGHSSFPSSHVRSEKPPTPPSCQSQKSPGSLLLTLAPQVQLDRHENGGSVPERLHDLVQLIPSEESTTEQSTVTCYVTQELLNSLVAEKNRRSVKSKSALESGTIGGMDDHEDGNIFDLLGN
jgi:hypothetical protein